LRQPACFGGYHDRLLRPVAATNSLRAKSYHVRSSRPGPSRGGARFVNIRAMRAVVQRVSRASVRVGDEVVGEIGPGLCVLVGVAQGDAEADAAALAEKVVGLRIFEDEAGKMNRDLLEVGGAILAVSQFTLLGDARKGRRPSFVDAMEPGRAAELFSRFCEEARARGARVQTGRFRAHMQVELVNDGPVTILLDTRKVF